MMIPTYNFEAMLAGWSRTHNGGSKITLWVNDEDLEQYFAMHTAKSGKHGGQRYQFVAVKLQDDDTPDPESVKPLAGIVKAHELAEAASAGAAIAAESIAKAHKPHFPLGLTGLAVKWCADEPFRFWLYQSGVGAGIVPAGERFDEAWAKAVICNVCGVMSRTELDSSPFAKERFETLIRTPYMEHLRTGGPT